MCAPVLKSFRGRIFAPTANDEIGMEYAYIDEPTYVLPETSRDGGASGGWIVLAAALTETVLGMSMGVLAVALAAVNVFGGFLVTRRMLEMFKKKTPKAKAGE